MQTTWTYNQVCLACAFDGVYSFMSELGRHCVWLSSSICRNWRWIVTWPGGNHTWCNNCSIVLRRHLEGNLWWCRLGWSRLRPRSGTYTHRFETMILTFICTSTSKFSRCVKWLHETQILWIWLSGHLDKARPVLFGYGRELEQNAKVQSFSRITKLCSIPLWNGCQ